MILRLEIEIVVSKGMSLFALISIFFSWMYVFFFRYSISNKTTASSGAVEFLQEVKKKKIDISVSIFSKTIIGELALQSFFGYYETDFHDTFFERG